MKKNLLLLSAALCTLLSANDFPNSSFEHDILPVWNRMPDDLPLVPDGKITRYTYSSDSVSGKRSLWLKGQKIRFCGESNRRFRQPGSFFALKMKAPRTAKVKVRCVFYLNTHQKHSVEKTFTVKKQWQEFKFSFGNPFGRFRRSGMTIGPFQLIIDPGKSEVLIDDCRLSTAGRQSVYSHGPSGGVPEKEMPLPQYIPLPRANEFASGKCGPGSWQFRLFPGGAGAEKAVPVSGVMLFPKSKVFFNSGTFALYDGIKKLSACFYPIAAWPQDKSLAALKVDFTADTASKVKTIDLRFTPGKAPVLPTDPSSTGVYSFKNGVSVNLSNSHIWEKNGKLKSALLKGKDYTGREYTFQSRTARIENGILFKRGALVSKDGKSIGMADIRLKSRAPRAGVEMDIAVSNTSKHFILIKELYWESRAPKDTAPLKLLIWGDHQKKTFTEVLTVAGKKQINSYKTNHADLPETPIQEKNGISLHVFNRAQSFPNELELAPGFVRGALWPSSAKVLSLAPGMTLRKKFLVSPSPLGKALDHPAAAMASAKDFAASGVMISMCPSDTKKFPLMEKKLQEGLGRLSFAELHDRFCYGQFNYGDHPGDGGWANLESFEDYVLYHHAMRKEDPALFQLAQAASRHYADIDTDIRSALPHIHSANHIIGGNGFGHAWIPGVMSAWLLTGDPAFYQSAGRMLESCIKLPLDSGEIQQGRNFGFYLLTLAEGYAIFGKKTAAERYMAQLNYQISRYAKTAPNAAEMSLQRTSIPRQNSLFYVTSSGLVPFHCWYGLTAFLKMYMLTGNPLIKETLEKEFANIMNFEMTYRPQIETHWPGLPAEKLFPTIATDYLFGRGAFFYPVLAMYAKVSGKKEYLDLAVDTAYCGILATRIRGNIQDVFMAAPLAALPDNFSEAKQLQKIKKLLWQGAAPELLNGNFNESLLYSELVIPQKGIGSPRYPQWALKKPYPRYWHLVEGKQIISSMFMTFRGNYYTLDHKEFGRSAPSLRLDMTTKKYFSSGDLTSAKFRMEPGEWEYAVSIKKSRDTEIRQIGMRLLGFGKYSARIGVKITPENKVEHDTTTHPDFKLSALSYKETNKPGWKKLTFRFRIKERSLGVFRMVYKMLAKVKEAQIHVDDVEIRRIGN